MREHVLAREVAEHLGTRLGEAEVGRFPDGEVLVALDRFAAAQVDDSHLEFARRMARRFRCRWPGTAAPGS